MVSVRTVAIVILDSRIRTSTETKYVKTLTIVLLAWFEQWRPDASENPMRAAEEGEELVLNVFVSESGDSFGRSSPRTYGGGERSPGMTIAFALIQTVGMIAERSSPSSCDGVDCEFCSVFDECLELCKENGAFLQASMG